VSLQQTGEASPESGAVSDCATSKWNWIIRTKGHFPQREPDVTARNTSKSSRQCAAAGSSLNVRNDQPMVDCAYGYQKEDQKEDQEEATEVEENFGQESGADEKCG
jgi:hypothetical protein